MKLATRWWALTILIVAAVLLYLLGPVLTPFLVAALFAYLADPLVTRLERWRLSRLQAVSLVFVALSLGIAGVLAVLLPLLNRELLLLAGRIPAYIDWFETTVFPWVRATFGIDLASLDLDALRSQVSEHWQSAGGVLAAALSFISRSGLTLVGWVANLLLIPVVTFYFLRDWPFLLERLRELLPRRLEPEAVRLARESDEVLGAFLRGQLMVMVALGLVYSVGLWMVGLDLAFIIGMLAGTVSFVPYLGFIVGITAAGVAALFQFHDWLPLAYVTLVFAVGQLLEGSLFTPLLVGERIGLHPVAVIFSVLAGGQLFGFVGVLLGLPAAAVVMVLLRYAHARYLESSLYEERKEESA